MNDETHLGFFDVSLASNIPGVVFLEPTCLEEYLAMLDWAIAQEKAPVIVRTPGGPVRSDSSIELLQDYSEPQYEIVEQGADVAVIAAGTFFEMGRQATEIMKDKGLRPTLVNPVPQGVISIASLAINVLALALIIKRSKEQKKNPYKQEIFTDTKDFQLAMARAEEQ